ncbi:hypothetical protein [Kosakonia sp. 1610]|uniref:hypothetical protein n=1 Tax=Kosakonia sp. 1610 TaxID=3156426 RepID=UPI003D22075A
MSTVNLFSYEEIAEQEHKEPNMKLRLHWEGEQSEAKETTPARIMLDILDGEYTAEQFDEVGYCCTEWDYQREQEEQAE